MKMKKIKSLLLAITIIAIFGAGCKKVTVTTEVKADGSCIRTIVAKPDSEDIADTFWPMPKDSTWAIESYKQKKEGKDEKEYVYKAKKSFRRVTDLSQEFTISEPTDTTVAISCPVKFTKKHRLLFTYLHYQETYKAYNQFSLIPISDSLTIEQQALIDDDEYEDVYSNWLQANYFEEFYQLLLREVAKMANPQLTTEHVEKHKEIIMEAIDESDEDTAEEVVPRFLKKLSKILNTNAVYNLEKPLLNPTRLLFKRAFLMLDMDDDEYVNRVAMPGQLITTDADTLEGNFAKWEIKPSDWRFKDFIMTVESRVINWTAVLMVAIITILLALIAVSTLKRRREAG